MSEWYNDLGYKDFDGKHVLVTLDDGTTISGAITYDTLGLTAKKEDDTCSGYICMSATAPILIGAYTAPKRLDILVNMEDCRWRPLDGIKSVDLVWDERDWQRTSLDDIEAIDALVVAGRLYELVSHKPDCDLWQVRVPGEKHAARISTSMISCALRRKVNVPVKPGFYKDTLGEFWARAAKSTGDRPWWSVEPDALDQPAKSDKYMSNLMPLTPVHFVDGRAPEPGDELASVMRVTSKGVTFTTEAA